MRTAIIILLISLLFVLFACSASNKKSSNLLVMDEYAEEFDWREISPIEFLEILKEAANNEVPVVTIWSYPPPGWIKEKHIHKLIKLIDSQEPAAYTVSALSSYIPQGRSTVGDEAIFLIEGFVAGVYPPELFSHKAKVNPEDIREWYLGWGDKPVSSAIRNSNDNR